MDIDPMEAVPEEEKREPSGLASLTSRVAITVALVATFLGICKVKDDNIVQAMQQAQADRLDHWNFYQARNIRQDVAAAEATQLRLSASAAPAAAQDDYRRAIAAAESRAAEESAKKEELRTQAEQDQQNYDALNYRDDQFDLCDALLALAISMMAVTALTRKEWLYFFALIPTVAGVVMGMAGLFQWPIHPDIFARFLS
jgi:uncharacterized protein DUF4337